MKVCCDITFHLAELLPYIDDLVYGLFVFIQRSFFEKRTSNNEITRHDNETSQFNEYLNE